MRCPFRASESIAFETRSA